MAMGDYGPMVYAAAVLGLRWDEVAGLRVGRLDLPNAAQLSGPGEIAIRPHALVLAEQRDGSAKVWLEGTVTEREFLGEFVRYGIKVGDTHLIADQSHYVGGATYDPGTRIHVGIDPAQVRLLPS